MELFKLINEIQKRTLDKTTEKQNLQTVKRYQEKGLSLLGGYNVELRELIQSQQKFSGEKVVDTLCLTSPDIEKILSKTFYIPNCVSNVIAPYINTDSAQWLAQGAALTTQEHTFSSGKLKPHRLSTQITLSGSLLKSTGENMEQMIIQALVNSIYSKLIATIFSSIAETEQNPKGIFNGQSIIEIASLNDLMDFQYEHDKNGKNNTFIISPKAKKEINKLSTNYPLINNDKLLNSDCICSNLIEDGYFCYLPLEYLAVADWGAVSITVNPITKAVQGETEITIDMYFDYSLLSDGLIKVGRFSSI